VQSKRLSVARGAVKRRQTIQNYNIYKRTMQRE